MTDRSACPRDRTTAYRYVLRLLAVEAALAFEDHLQKCDRCGSHTAELTKFLTLLRSVLRSSTSTDEATRRSMEAFLNSSAESVSPRDESHLVQAFINCFSGYERLRRNLSTRLESGSETERIDRAAMEIMLALPAHLQKSRK